jgi:hypothetical protein
MNEAPDESLQLWVSRTAQLEGALQRGGHVDLLPAVHAVARLLNALAHADVDDRAQAIELVSRALRAVRSSLVSPGLPIEGDLVSELDRAARSLRVDPAADPPLDEDDAMGGLLDVIGSAGDDELGALADSVRRIAAAAPRDELGTLREPIASQKNGDRDAAVRVLMKGELNPGLLADLIQLFAQNAETGLLAVESEGVSASIYFKDGKISDAECGAETGEKAFFQTMLVRQGRFSYQRGVETSSTRIFRSAQHLIMETLRLMDESA